MYISIYLYIYISIYRYLYISIYGYIYIYIYDLWCFRPVVAAASKGSVCDPFPPVSLGIKSGLGLESFVGAGQASCYRACAAWGPLPQGGFSGLVSLHSWHHLWGVALRLRRTGGGCLGSLMLRVVQRLPSGDVNVLSTRSCDWCKSGERWGPRTSGGALWGSGHLICFPALAEAAMQAGVGADTLDEVASLMAKSVTAQKVLDVNTKIATDPLSDIKEEEQVQELEGPLGLVCGVPADPLQQAVVHLADIVKATTGKKRSGSKLETALEATAGLSSDSVTVGTSTSALQRQEGLFAQCSRTTQKSFTAWWRNESCPRRCRHTSRPQRLQPELVWSTGLALATTGLWHMPVVEQLALRIACAEGR